jgi:5-methylcytosine-specific restriction endonuclease McrA
LADDSKNHRNELKEWYKRIKSSGCCFICGAKKYLQYHHINPDNKVDNVARLVHACAEKDIIIEEMSKCVLLCRRCHCRVHAKLKIGIDLLADIDSNIS